MLYVILSLRECEKMSECSPDPPMNLDPVVIVSNNKVGYVNFHFILMYKFACYITLKFPNFAKDDFVMILLLFA